jgi:hypothetical protein
LTEHTWSTTPPNHIVTIMLAAAKSPWLTPGG